MPANRFLTLFEKDWGMEWDRCLCEQVHTCTHFGGVVHKHANFTRFPGMFLKQQNPALLTQPMKMSETF